MKAATHVRRRDGAGHLDPSYAADLLAPRRARAKQREEAAFFQAPRTRDTLAEQLGESFVETATSGENAEGEVLDQFVPEETGGPFVETTEETELGHLPKRRLSERHAGG